MLVNNWTENDEEEAVERDEGRESRERRAVKRRRIDEEKVEVERSRTVREDVIGRRNGRERDLQARIEGIKETIRRLSEELEQVLRASEGGQEEYESEGGEGPEGAPENERKD